VKPDSAIAKAFLLFLFLFLIGVIGLLLRFPLSGVDAVESFEYRGEEFTLELVDQVMLEGKYSGEFDLVEDRITIATDNWGLWSFVSTCSHELYHVDRKIDGEGLSESREHELMPTTEVPWNWKWKCIELTSVRVGSTY